MQTTFFRRWLAFFLRHHKTVQPGSLKCICASSTIRDEKGQCASHSPPGYSSYLGFSPGFRGRLETILEAGYISTSNVSSRRTPFDPLLPATLDFFINNSFFLCFCFEHYGQNETSLLRNTHSVRGLQRHRSSGRHSTVREQRAADLSERQILFYQNLTL